MLHSRPPSLHPTTCLTLFLFKLVKDICWFADILPSGPSRVWMCAVERTNMWPIRRIPLDVVIEQNMRKKKDMKSYHRPAFSFVHVWHSEMNFSVSAMRKIITYKTTKYPHQSSVVQKLAGRFLACSQDRINNLVPGANFLRRMSPSIPHHPARFQSL